MGGTLKSIAEMAKVSPSAVSRALAGKPGVSEAKRREIRRLAAETGFELNLQARLLRTNINSGLAIINSQRGSEIAYLREEILLKHGEAAFETARPFVVGGPAEINSALQRICAERFQAVVINGFRGDVSSESSSILREKGIPVCALDADYKEFDCVQINRAAGTYQAARMLLLSGCKNPVFFLSPTEAGSDPRLKGVEAAFRSLGRSPSEIVRVPLRGSGFEAGTAMTTDLINSMRVDGIFTYSDAVGIGVLRALHKAGLRAPEDVKVIGFDNIPVSAWLPVSLTTAAQPIDEAAQKAMGLLKERIQTPGAPPRRISLPVRLLVRESAPITDNKLRDEIFKIPENI
jgi:DNA-binding LacI/PurR family transcriptional regulator